MYRLTLKLVLGELLPVVVVHDEIRFAFLDRPGRREAATRQKLWRSIPWFRTFPSFNML